MNDIGKFLNKRKFKKILVVSGKNSFYKSGVKNFINFEKIKHKIIFFFKESKIPEINELNKIIQIANLYNPNLILAIGGGSVIDYAKLTNTLYLNRNLKSKIINNKIIIKKKTILAAIPTTAGSGAEVTPNSVVYINKIKYAVDHPSLKPDYFFLVPRVIIKSGLSIKSSAGFDAISQSLESLISRKSNSTSVKYATKSLKLSFKSFLNFVKKPNLKNTFDMCLAANLSGKAISISKTTAPHAVSYPFTSHFGIPHGHAVSLTLNNFLNHNYKNLQNADVDFSLKSRFQTIFNAAGVKNIKELNDYLNFLKKNSKLSDDLPKLGINIKSKYKTILSGVNLERLNNNPVKISKFQLKKILFQIGT